MRTLFYHPNLTRLRTLPFNNYPKIFLKIVQLYLYFPQYNQVSLNFQDFPKVILFYSQNRQIFPLLISQYL